MSKYQSPKVKVNFNAAKAVLAAVLILIIIGVVATASVKIVDSGHRGVLLHWDAVDLTVPPLDEGLHFVTPFQDDVVNIEVRTLKYASEARSASQDLQTVETTVTV
nr:prohibitin family protein [archaeon]